MKQYTVKDFILYNGPFISCGENILLELGVLNIKDTNSFPSTLKTTVSNERTSISLKLSYYNALHLQVDHKSNKFISSDFNGFDDYLNGHKLFLRSKCNKCNSFIDSQFLEFNTKRGFIKPVGISVEYFIIHDNTYIYHIKTSILEAKTLVVVDRVNKATPVSPIRFELPILQLSKFKNKENVINKIKTYITFS